MEKEKAKGVIEAILFSTGRNVKMAELINILELDSKTIIEIITEMQDEYKQANRGIEIVRVEDGFSLASKKEYYEYLYPALDKRIKPSLSQACLETLAIIAYNSRITRADTDAIRGVDSTSALYRLQDYNLIEQAGKADLPGRPVLYRTTEDFLKMFGLNSLKELPKLPRYKLDSNRQLVIDEMNDEVIEDEGEIDIEPTTDEPTETEAPIEEPEIEINESDIDIDNSNNEESNEENNNE